MDVEFKSIEELKKRLMPALRLRKKELKKVNYFFSEDELWDYFSKNFWRNATNLSLSQMVDDILNQEIVFNNEDNII